MQPRNGESYSVVVLAALVVVAEALRPSVTQTSFQFIRGDRDVNAATTGVADALQMLTINFVGGLDARWRAACDTNGDGDSSGVRDALELLTKNFIGRVTIPAPHPDCAAGQLLDRWAGGL